MMWLPTPTAAVEGRAVDPPQTTSPDGTPSSTPTPQPSESPASPSIVRTGEIMLIFSLLLIFMVACFVALHFYLRSRRRKAKKAKIARDKRRKKQRKMEVSNVTETQDEDKEFAEADSIPLCEMGESEPRHEMEDIEVPECMTQGPIGSAISTSGPVAIPAAVYIPGPEPDEREHAVYLSARM